MSVEPKLGRERHVSKRPAGGLIMLVKGAVNYTAVALVGQLSLADIASSTANH